MYKYPFADDVVKEPVQPTGDFAHENFLESRYAIDFLLPVGTPILAARAGKVWKIKDDSDRHGLDFRFVNAANFVAIDHGDGTYAEYLHLKHDGTVVEDGQAVAAGDLLSYTGLSGCMDTPHLHFNVFKIESGKAVSIPFELLD